MSSQGSPATRVGWGFDAHPLDGYPPLVMGGVVVSETIGVSATSDGDVLAHAVTDAVLGACVLSDIGEHFPPDDPTLSGVDSLQLLSAAVAKAAVAGWQVSHLDATVVAEEVRIAPHRDEIRTKLADSLGIAVDSVSVKATTTDGLGFIGRGEGLAAVAVVTVTALP
ncbi:MAG TPA: 2-C-methyl-D-erythritol 2,4-cyclodiphosphate synthase [Acidimicrobiia bacterium]|nr:2-C-methyl-D-erythritol 2,4-cyclodiphosphate synthase [Acidimicrobiia bacterium]